MEKLNKMSVEFPGVVESKGDGYALYNGVKLPDIESVWTDKGKYPYACILFYDNTTYCLFLSTDKLRKRASTLVGGKDGVKGIQYQMENGSWSFLMNRDFGGTAGAMYAPAIWSSYDLNDTGGNLILAATSPLPLDGMQVIEWDGDTTGLDGLELSETITAYRVADYTYASNAVCVATHSEGYNEVFDGFGSSDTGWNVGAWALGVKDYGIRISTVEGWNDENSISYVSLLAYTPAAEEDTGDKINISFNDKIYSIDPSSLSSASDDLKSHLSTVMNGSGATINFDDVFYNIDSTKLVNAQNDFVSHLGTIAGNGHKVTVGGVEYGVDSAKVANAITDLGVVLGELQSGNTSTDADLPAIGKTV